MALPEHLQPVIHQGRAHKSIKNDPYVEPFVEWIKSEFEANRVYNLPGDMPGAPQRVPFGRKP